MLPERLTPRGWPLVRAKAKTQARGQIQELPQGRALGLVPKLRV